MGSVIPISSRQMMQPLLMGLNVEVALVEGNKFLTGIAISGNQVAGITCELGILDLPPPALARGIIPWRYERDPWRCALLIHMTLRLA